MNYQRFRPSSTSGIPPAVLNLIILNVIMLVVKAIAESRLIDLSSMLGLHHPFSPDFHFYQYITNMFMHADFSHLLFNMLGVWVFGAMLENAYGTKRFLIFYLVSGLGASLIYQAWVSISYYNELTDYFVGAAPGMIEALQTYPPLGFAVGASGAVYGILMGAALLFPNTEMNIMFIPIPIKLKWIAIGLGAMALFNGYQRSEGDDVAHFAHLGGMIFGFILVKIYSRNKTHFY